MSSHDQSGFTLTEIMIVMIIGALVITGVFSFFGSSINQYFRLQQESFAFADVAANSQRIASVMRGSTDIVSASANSITVYSYFSPYDQYASLITYYPDGTGTKLLADVTRLTANPPIGTVISGSLKTFTIIDNFYLPNGGSTFEYLNSAGGVLTQPITDMRTIKGIRINLASKPIAPSTQITKMTVDVSLRNRKTNL